MEHKIGEKFTIDGVEYITVEDKKLEECDKCAFMKKPVEFCEDFECHELLRNDGKAVIFLEVK